MQKNDQEYKPDLLAKGHVSRDTYMPCSWLHKHSDSQEKTNKIAYLLRIRKERKSQFVQYLFSAGYSGNKVFTTLSHSILIIIL